jgi:hypothetical protein
MCARRLFASEVDEEGARFAAGALVEVAGHLDQTPVVPAPLAGVLLVLLKSDPLVVILGEGYSEADVGARTSSCRDLY